MNRIDRFLHQPGRARTTRGAVMLVTMAVLLSIGSIASAVHSGGSVLNDLFELGPTADPVTNATNATNIIVNQAAGPDWDELCDYDDETETFAPSGNLFGGKSVSCIADDLSVSSAVDDTIFASSNKNGDAIGSWNWDTGNTPVKDDLSNVYAYAIEENGDLIVYAGLERLSSSGDSHVDIEFTQNEILLDKSPPCGDDETASAADGSPCEFSGTRTDDDIIVSLDYTKGGALGSLEVRKWDNGAFVEVVQLDGPGCNEDNGFDADAVCGFSNETAIAGGDWPSYDSHGAVIDGLLPTNSFAEFGINVNEALGLSEVPCFATVNAHTRSSQSFTAELKDFAAATFELCAPSTELSMSASTDTVHAGDEVTFTYTETNDGIDDLHAPNPGDADPTQTDGNGGWVEDDGCTDVTHVLGESNDAVPAGDGGTPSSNETHNVGDLNNDNVLNSGETWTFECTTVVAATQTNTAIGHGIATGFDPDVDVTYCTDGANIDGSGLNGSGQFCDLDEQATATVTVINPSTTLFKTAKATITFHYYETNDNGGQLTAPNPGDADPTQTDGNGGWVEDDKCSPVLHVLGIDNGGTAVDESTFNVGDADTDNRIDGGETWVFVCTVTVDEGDDYDETNTATGHGIDGIGSDVTWCEDESDPPDDTVCDQDERDSVSVTITHNAPNPPPS